MQKVLVVFGTRPEAIKMAPVVHQLRKHPESFATEVVVTAQHRQMLDQVLELFGIVPEYDLNIMKAGQDLFDVTCGVLGGMKEVLARCRPDLVLVHGDTTTTMAASLAAFYARVPVGHVEAGLRTGDKSAPFPEEINRRVAGCLADYHFAPTPIARDNLLAEGVPPHGVTVTGNTVIDALLEVVATLDGDSPRLNAVRERFAFLDPAKRLVLVTGHRRENFGAGFQNICLALRELADANPDVEILYPVHLNPNVREPVGRILGSGTPWAHGAALPQGPVPSGKNGNLFLIDPQEYLPFVYLMQRSYLIITDSGGVQEEAPSLGKPVLVMRSTTERPEAVTAGTVQLVGTDRETIRSSAQTLLDDPAAYRRMSTAHNPYGDGRAAERIVAFLRELG